MKFFRCLSIALVGLLVVPLASCDKVTSLLDKAKGLVGSGEDAETTIEGSVEADEKQAKEIIAAETRMVIVEFYSDT